MIYQMANIKKWDIKKINVACDTKLNCIQQEFEGQTLDNSLFSGFIIAEKNNQTEIFFLPLVDVANKNNYTGTFSVPLPLNYDFKDFQLFEGSEPWVRDAKASKYLQSEVIKLREAINNYEPLEKQTPSKIIKAELTGTLYSSYFSRILKLKQIVILTVEIKSGRKMILKEANAIKENEENNTPFSDGALTLKDHITKQKEKSPKKEEYNAEYFSVYQDPQTLYEWTVVKIISKIEFYNEAMKSFSYPKSIVEDIRLIAENYFEEQSIEIEKSEAISASYFRKMCSDC
jgi:hypothetical protein